MSIVMYRAIGFWAMSFMALVSLCFQWHWILQNSKIFWLAVIVAGLFSLLTSLFALIIFVSDVAVKDQFGFVLRNRIGKLYLRFHRSAHVFSQNYGVLFKAFILSLASQSVAITFLILASKIQGVDALDLAAYFFIIPMGFIAMSLPIAPAGIGVGQAVLFFLFQAVLGVESSVAPNAMTAFQAVSLVCSLSGAYFYLKYKPISQVNGREVVNVG